MFVYAYMYICIYIMYVYVYDCYFFRRSANIRKGHNAAEATSSTCHEEREVNYV